MKKIRLVDIKISVVHTISPAKGLKFSYVQKLWFGFFECVFTISMDIKENIGLYFVPVQKYVQTQLGWEIL